MRIRLEDLATSVNWKLASKAEAMVDDKIGFEKAFRAVYEECVKAGDNYHTEREVNISLREYCKKVVQDNKDLENQMKCLEHVNRAL
jgi:tRNA(Ser,Leu) C12 N-acetylase TAN1